MVLNITGLEAVEGKEHPRQQGQSVQRSWGSTVPGMLEEQRGDLCGWSSVREGERGDVRVGCARLFGLLGGLGLLPGEVGALEDGQRKKGT